MVETTEQYRARINQIKTSIEQEPAIRKMRDDIAEGISKTGNRQADIEVRQDALEDDFVAVQQDASAVNPSGAEVAVARGSYPTLDGRLTTKEQEVTTQFAQTLTHIDHLANNILITPDNFEGTDLEKMQQAYDYAVENNIETIHLNREYDLTGGSVYLKSGNFPSNISYAFGKLVKRDSGFMFTRALDQTNNTNSPSFIKVRFEGQVDADVYIIDGDRMIRTKAVLCKFQYISLIKTIGYTQSLRMFFCVMDYATNSFIKSKQNIDLDISHNEFETSPNHLIETISDSLTSYANSGFRFVDNLVEGYTTKPPIVTSSGIGFNVNENYFEQNLGHIKFTDGGGLKNISGKIDGNYLMHNLSNYDVEFSGHITSRLTVPNNTTNIVGVNKALLSHAVYEADNNNLYAGGNLYPLGTRYSTNSKKLNTITPSGVNGLTFKIKMDVTRVDGLLGKSFLVTVGATFGSSVNYRANYVGILSFNGYYDASLAAVRTKVQLKHISLIGIGANTNGTDGYDTDVNVTFGHKGTSDSTPTDNLTTVDINFPKLKYDATYTTISFKPIEDMLLQGYKTT